MATGGVRIGQNNAWNTYNQPANMISNNTWLGGLSYSNNYLINELNSVSASGLFSRKNSAIGLYTNMQGYSVSNQLVITTSFAQRLRSTINAGISIHFLQEHLSGDEFKDQRTFAFSLALNSDITEHFVLDFIAFNPTYGFNSISPYFVLGGKFLLSDQSTCFAQVTVGLNNRTAFNFGLMHKPDDKWFIAIGMGSNPSLFSFGLGLSLSTFEFQTAFSHHPILGFSPSVTALIEK